MSVCSGLMCLLDLQFIFQVTEDSCQLPLTKNSPVGLDHLVGHPSVTWYSWAKSNPYSKTSHQSLPLF